MDIESHFNNGVIANFLTNMDEVDILYLIRFSLASNDLISNLDALEPISKQEKSYFFYNSVSIVREIAKLVDEISSSSGFEATFSDDTAKSFNKLKENLKPFNEESLSKSVLKPVRDTHLHYTFLANSTYLTSLIDDLKNMPVLDVGIKPNDDRLMSVRYTYADWFRAEYINNYLSDDHTKLIANLSVEIIAFIDGLLTDLITQGQ
jgi:hypothetical protein